VPDLEVALKALETEGVRTSRKRGNIALLDPATTLGLPIEIVE
jgi:hypothetical protein